MMKKTKVALLVVAMAAVSVTAMADTAGGGSTGHRLKWDGTTPVFAETCAFSVATHGAMSFDEALDTWTVSDPALITVKVRKVDSLSVTTDENLYDGASVVTPTRVDYRNGSSVSAQEGFAGGIIKEITAQAIDVSRIGGSRGFVDIKLGGTAQHIGQKVLLESQKAYHIKHVVSCIQ